MKCINCGAECKENDKFCMVCGATIQKPVSEQACGDIMQKSASEQGGIPITAPAQEESEVLKKKPKKKTVVKIAIAAIAVAVVVLVATNISALANTVKKMFMSPDEYYRSVETNYLTEWLESGLNGYDNALSSLIDSKNQKLSGSAKLKLGDKAKSMIKDATDVSLKDINDVSVNYMTNINDGNYEFNLGCALNDDNLLSIALQYDAKNSVAYASIPLLSEKSIGLDMEELLGEVLDEADLDEYMEQYSEIQEKIKQFPDKKKLNTITQRYVKVLLDGITGVEETDGVLEAEGVSQKCTVMMITLDSEDILDLCENVLTEAEDDKELADIISSIAETMGADSDDVIDEWEEAIEDALSDIEDIKDNDDKNDIEIIMEVYVDSEGSIVGRVITVTEKSDGYVSKTETELRAMMPRDGREIGYELSALTNRKYEDGTTDKNYLFDFAGSGTASGDKLSGDISIKVQGAKIIQLELDKFDIGDLKKGNINGKLTIAPSSLLVDLLTEELSYNDQEMLEESDLSLSKFALQLDFDSDKKKSKTGISLLYKDELFASLTLNAERGSGKSITFPKDDKVIMVEDEEGLLDYVESIDLDGYVKHLKETDLPSEFIDLLEDMEDDFSDDLFGELRDEFGSKKETEYEVFPTPTPYERVMATPTPTKAPSPTPTPTKPVDIWASLTDGEMINGRFLETRYIDVQVMDRDMVDGTDVTSNIYTDYIRESLLEEHNIYVNFVPISRWTEIEQLNTHLAAGGAPDICYTYHYPAIETYANMGSVIELSESVEELKPILSNLWDFLGDDYINFNKDPNDGELWAIARKKVDNNNPITFVRKDWLDKLGLSEPTTTEEFEEMLIAFRDNAALLLGDDADKMIPYSINYDIGWRASLLIESFLDPEISDKEFYINGSDSTHIMQEGTKEAIRILNRWYNEGLIWEDFEQITFENESLEEDMMKAGYVGAFQERWDYPYSNGIGSIDAALQDAFGYDAGYIAVDCFTNQYGECVKMSSAIPDVYIFFPSTNQEPLASLVYLDWISDPEHIAYLQKGEEGITHEVLYDGSVSITRGEGEAFMNSLYNVDYTITCNGLYLGDEEVSVLSNAHMLCEGADILKAVRANELAGRGIMVRPNVNVILTEDINSIGILLDSNREQWLINSVIAKEDEFDSTWDNYYQNYLVAGGNTIKEARINAWESVYGFSEWIQ